MKKKAARADRSSEIVCPTGEAAVEGGREVVPPAESAGVFGFRPSDSTTAELAILGKMFEDYQKLRIRLNNQAEAAKKNGSPQAAANAEAGEASLQKMEDTSLPRRRLLDGRTA